MENKKNRTPTNLDGEEYPKKHFDFIRNNPIMNNSQLGRILGVSHDVIRKHRIHMGIIKGGRSSRKTMKTNLYPDLNKYLLKKKMDFEALSIDATIRIIIREWIALKKEKIKRERESTIDNNINARAQE